MTNKTVEDINNIVFKGMLPVSFFDSKVIDLNVHYSDILSIPYFNEKYQQKSILRKVSGQVISKIF